jgi:pilus assembly protein Flp/PilA
VEFAITFNPTVEVAMKAIKRFLKSEEGPTAVEYAVMLAFIIAVCVTAISTMGSHVSSTFANAGL